jgi:DNA-binding beta-propeller fold protein YncE
VTDASPRNPYVGPRPIHRGEAFYGRDPELHRLTNLLTAERIVLLHAPSGAGKSSLLNAGLIPRLENEKNMQVLPVLRVNRLPEDAAILPQGVNRYLLSILLSLDETFGEAALSEAELAEANLSGYLEQRWPADPDKRGRLLLFDQFEEVFSLDPYDREAKLELFTRLGVTLQDRSFKALFLVRDDYIGALEPYSVYLPSQLQTAFRLDFLDHTAALEAIMKPAQQAGVLFEEEAAHDLVHDLSLVQYQRLDGTAEQQEGPYVEPVQLQVVCKRLWEHLEESGRLLDGIDQVDVEQLGDVSDALAGYYRDTVRTVARQEKVPEASIRRWIDKELISEQGVRGQVMLVGEQTKGLSNQAITALENAHLLRREERRRVIWYELAHDRLVQPVQRDNLRFYEAQRGRRLKQVFAALGGVALIIILISIVSTLSARANEAAAVATSSAAFSAVQQDALQAARGAGTAQAGATQVAQNLSVAQADVTQAALGAATAQAEATQAALALLPISELQALSRSGEVSTRSSTAHALGSAGAANPKLAGDATNILASMMQAANEINPTVRLDAAQGLMQIAGQNPAALVQSVPAIISAAQDPDPRVRLQVAQLLGRVGPYVLQSDLNPVIRTLEVLSRDPVAQVSGAARESLQALSALNIESYVDIWTNIDPNTRSWTRIEIHQRGEELGYHIFGKCHPTDCDAGEVWAPYNPGAQVFTMDQGFATATFTVTLDLETQYLNVDSFIHYIDNSGRPEQFLTDQFVRGEPIPATPTATPRLRPSPSPSVTGPRLYAALYWESYGLAMIDLSSGKVLNTTQFPSINASYLSINPKRREVYVSFVNGDNLYIIDAESGEIKGWITEGVGWNSSASVVSPDGSRLYLATSGGPEKERSNKILVIDPAAQQLLRIIPLGAAPFPAILNGLEISPDGRWLYTVDSENHQLFIIEAETGVVEPMDVKGKGDQLVGISADGEFLYLAGGDFLMKIETRTGTVLWRTPQVRSYINRLAIANGLVYVPGEKDNILILNDGSGKVADEISGGVGGSLVLSPDAQFLYTAANDTILVYDVLSHNLVQTIPITVGSGPTDLVYWSGE